VAKFLVTYIGGSGPPTDAAQAEQIKQAFGRWLGEAGSAVVDPGAPLRPGTHIATGTPEAGVTIGGYSVVEAPSLDEAVDILRSHPFVARGGTLQVDQAVDI